MDTEVEHYQIYGYKLRNNLGYGYSHSRNQ